MSRRKKRNRRNKTMPPNATVGGTAIPKEPAINLASDQSDVASHKQELSLLEDRVKSQENSSSEYNQTFVGDRSDLAKHLRLINFTILVVSAGLALSTAYRPATRIDRAIADLDRISQIATEWETKDIQSLMHETASEHFADTIPPVYIRTDDGEKLYLASKKAWTASSNTSSLMPRADGNRERSSMLSGDGTRVRTLSDFSNLWNLLSQSHYILQPTDLRKGSGMLIRHRRQQKEHHVPVKVGHDWRALYVFNRDFSRIASLGTTTGDRVTFGFAPDKTTLIASLRDHDRRNQLFSVALAEKSRKLSAFNRIRSIPHSGFSISPTGDTVALRNGREVRFFDYESGDMKGEYRVEGGGFSLGYSRQIKDVVFSPDDSMAALLTEEMVLVLQVSDMELKHKIRPAWRGDDSGGYSSIAFSSSGQFIAVGLNRHELFPAWGPSRAEYQTTILNTSDWQTLHVFDCAEAVTSLSFSMDEHFLAASTRAGSITIWELQEFGIHRSFNKVHSSRINCIRYSPDDSVLATASSDSRVCLWDTNTGDAIEEWKGEYAFKKLEFTPGGKYMVVGTDLGQSVAMNDAVLSENTDSLENADTSSRTIHLTAVQKESFGTSRDTSLEARVTFNARSVPMDYRKHLAELSDKKFRAFSLIHDNFDRSFPELSTQTEGVRDAPLKDVWSVLNSQRQLVGEQFEYFGIKVPVVVLSTFGIWLLAVLEFYFFLHLNKLTSSISQNDPAWNVPWIGVYSGAWPKLAVISSAVFAPLFTGYWLHRLEAQAGAAWWSFGFDSTSVANGVLFVASAGCSWQIYKFSVCRATSHLHETVQSNVH